ncbi:FAD:protein FMN transferase [Janibacter sp. GXQ6167]|uniref:FAD:protein FMN transferase n=1 Tax=Janibacter sp. GXQ6167 TaxID=3240791 RepID=UPI003525DCFB
MTLLTERPTWREFRAIGTRCRVVATDPEALDAAVALTRAELAALDLAASRFRTDSEVSRLAEVSPPAPGGPGTTTLSPLLAEYLRAALTAAELTGGLVNPTIGQALLEAGYTDDIDVVRSRTSYPARSTSAAAPAVSLGSDPIAWIGPARTMPVLTAHATWRDLDLLDNSLTMPAGTLIDLGATAKAYAADRIASTLADRLGGGFLVDLGGDLASSGELPHGGWVIAVVDGSGRRRATVLGTGQGFATSSTAVRRWAIEGGEAHHIIDPRTGRSADAVWEMVTVSARSALLANTASTAAIILGSAAPAWLSERGLPARLQHHDGRVITTSGWPTDEAGATPFAPRSEPRR